jgi:hypothetical protein
MHLSPRIDTRLYRKLRTNKADRDRGPDCSGAPPTPPSMRIRPRCGTQGIAGSVQFLRASLLPDLIETHQATLG